MPPPSAAAAPPSQHPVQPLIPLSIIDAPSQRFYAVALVIAIQAWKYTRAISSLLVSSDSWSSSISLSNAIFINFSLLFLLSRLGIPRLDPRLAQQSPPASGQQTGSVAATSVKSQGLTHLKYLIIFATLSFVDALILGNGAANPFYLLLSWLAGFLKFASTLLGFNLELNGLGADSFARQLSISEGQVRIRDLIQPKSHILGQHTIHILPYSTARLSPASACYCIGPQSQSVSIPVFFNNTEPDLLQYSVTDFVSGELTLYNVSISGLVSLQSSEVGSSREAEDLQAMAVASASRTGSAGGNRLNAEQDELDEPISFLKGLSYHERAKARAAKRSRGSKAEVANAARRSGSSTQLLYQLPVEQVGRIRLERVLDRNRNDARLSSVEALVVECPTMTFVDDGQDGANLLSEPEHKCPGDKSELGVKVRGLTPLELDYRRMWSPPTLKKGAREARGKHHGNQEDELQTISRISSSHQSSPLLLPEADSLLGPIERLALARERTRAAAAASGSKREDYSWAAASEVHLPLGVELERSGHYTYMLEGVRDACGNFVSAPKESDLASKARRKLKSVKISSVTVTSRQITVHTRATIAFNRQVCLPGQPIKLLRMQPDLNLTLESSGADEASGPWEIDVSFEPDNSGAEQEPLPRKAAKAWSKAISVPSGSDFAGLRVEAPGIYRIDKVSGPYCGGEVGAPWACEVIDVPPPTAKITFSSIEDRCAGAVGVKALSVLTGTPPFRLEYEVRKQGQEPTHHVKRVVDQTRDELEFRPNTEGAVTYKFLKLHDANYKDMVLDGPTFTQVVHPLAAAKFAAAKGHEAARPIEMHSCAGNKAQVDVELSGAGPWDLTYSIRGGGTSETKEVKKIKDHKYTLDFELPAQVAELGGRVTVSLVSIRDSKGCERPLATSDLNIHVKRAKPSVGFLPVAFEKRRQVEMLDGKQAQLSLRLDGEGPWHIKYTWRADEQSTEEENTVMIKTASRLVVVERPGIYTIKSVQDAYCPGSVNANQEVYHVFVKSRPLVQFADDAGSFAKNGSLIRSPVCQSRPDAVDVQMKGNFPLHIAYEHQAPSWSGASDIDGSNVLASAAGELASQGKRRKASFSSAQSTSSLELSTITPGWHVYTLNVVGDAVYPSTALTGFSRDAPRRLEQMVYPLPNAQFVRISGRRAPSFCLGDSLGGQHANKGDTVLPTIRLSGTAPFTVDFELHDSSIRASSEGFKKIIRAGIKSHEYKLEVPKEEFVFETKGKWSLRVTRVQDANGCEYVPGGVGRALPASAMMEIEVADTAGIAAASSRDDYCIGEAVDFVLQGTPPWTVTYDFNGKVTQAAAKLPDFSRVAEKSGVLTIKSVAHQQNHCKTEVDPRFTQGMVKTIHELPTVKISEGRHHIEDLREGNQAEILFSLRGIPPYSFTYQRTEPADTHSRPKVLETHTVTGILENQFSIWTSVEGTWSVTWLQDRWCQVSLDSHSGASTPLGKSRLAIKEA